MTVLAHAGPAFDGLLAPVSDGPSSCWPVSEGPSVSLVHARPLLLLVLDPFI